jgi:hypothetical protein
MDHENIVPASIGNTFETQRKGGNGGTKEVSRNAKTRDLRVYVTGATL